jgi:hypothetical protein
MTPTPNIHPARGPLRWFFARTRYAGLCLPPIGIWLAPELLTWQRAGMPGPVPGTAADRLLIHELRHWHQARVLGVWRWYALYAWWTLTRGYQANPLEQDARAVAAAYLPPDTAAHPVPGATRRAAAGQT